MRLTLIALTLSCGALASCGGRTTLGGSDSDILDQAGSGGSGVTGGASSDSGGGGAATGGVATTGGATSGGQGTGGSLVPQGPTERVSVGTPNVEAPAGGFIGGISGDGELVVFISGSALDGGAELGLDNQIFLRNRSTLVTERISEVNGVKGNQTSGGATISEDGKVVAFFSSASNFVSGDTNHAADVFVVERGTGVLERVSVSSANEQANNACYVTALSSDGRYVVFWSYATNLAPEASMDMGVFVRDRQLGLTTNACLNSNGEPANGDCDEPDISGDGRYVSFTSDATNLGLVGFTTGQVYVRDLVTGVTDPVSWGVDGALPGAESMNSAISNDGRYVAFSSAAANLVPDDTNGKTDVFVRDRLNGTTVRVSVDTLGGQGNGDSEVPDISGDGRLVSFRSCSTNLVVGDTNNQCDVFVRDLELGILERVSLGVHDEQGDRFSRESRLSTDGRFVLFNSLASNLGAGDTNNTNDVFVRTRW